MTDTISEFRQVFLIYCLDGCIPTDSDANWTAYSVRLQRLSGYKIEH